MLDRAFDLLDAPATEVAEPPLLAARGLYFQTGGCRLLDGVDLALDAQGVTVMMGPNGLGRVCYCGCYTA